jgi:hypothetical protein
MVAACSALVRTIDIPTVTRAKMTKTIGTRRLDAVMVSPLTLNSDVASLQLPVTGVKIYRSTLAISVLSVNQRREISVPFYKNAERVWITVKTK